MNLEWLGLINQTNFELVVVVLRDAAVNVLVDHVGAPYEAAQIMPNLNFNPFDWLNRIPMEIIQGWDFSFDVNNVQRFAQSLEFNGNRFREFT